jgi:protoporphyrinogen/coproporphyrinogen III oxidase
MEQKNNIVVVGGGPAGLAAAFQLKQAGCQVTIQDTAPVIGGKLRTQYRHGFTLDQGAFFIPTTHRRMVALAGEAGFGNMLDPGGTTMAAARDGKIHTFCIDHVVRDLVKTAYFPFGTKLSLIRLASSLWQCSHTYFDRIADAARFDGETAAAWAESAVTPELAEFVVDLVMRGMAGASAANSSRIEFLGLLYLLKGAKLVACQGGMGVYAEQLARDCQLKPKLRVHRVVNHGNTVEVLAQGDDGSNITTIADGCVVATPAPVTANIVSGLDEWRRGYLGSTPDKKSIIVNIALCAPPDDVQASYILLPRSVHPFICGICSDHHKAPGRVPEGKGLLTLMLTYEWSGEHFLDSDEDILTRVLDGLDRVLPGNRSKVEFAEVVRWDQRYNPPGHYRHLKQFRELCNNEDNRVQLAGDYFGYANLESAICSGEEAAVRLLARLSAT